MNVKETIQQLELKLSNAETAKRNLINANANQINQVIEEKIMEMKEELREYGIEKVCGDAYKKLDAEVKNQKKALDTLRAIEADSYLLGLVENINKEEAPAEEPAVEETAAPAAEEPKTEGDEQ